ncbi:MAG: hypothetical protein ACI93P_001830 [bacterium]|jgi:hypothetical protein
MIYSFIKNNEQVFPIEKMYKVPQVIIGSYNRWEKQISTSRKQRNGSPGICILDNYYGFIPPKNYSLEFKRWGEYSLNLP